MKQICYSTSDKQRKPLIIAIASQKNNADQAKQIEIVLCPHGEHEDPCLCDGISPVEGASKTTDSISYETAADIEQSRTGEKNNETSRKNESANTPVKGTNQSGVQGTGASQGRKNVDKLNQSEDDPFVTASSYIEEESIFREKEDSQAYKTVGEIFKGPYQSIIGPAEQTVAGNNPDQTEDEKMVTASSKMGDKTSSEAPKKPNQSGEKANQTEDPKMVTASSYQSKTPGGKEIEDSAMSSSMGTRQSDRPEGDESSESSTEESSGSESPGHPRARSTPTSSQSTLRDDSGVSSAYSDAKQDPHITYLSETTSRPISSPIPSLKEAPSDLASYDEDVNILPVISPRYHGPGCVLEVSILEKHDQVCPYKKGPNDKRHPIDDSQGSYDYVGRMVFKTCNPNPEEDEIVEVAEIIPMLKLSNSLVNEDKESKGANEDMNDRKKQIENLRRAMKKHESMKKIASSQKQFPLTTNMAIQTSTCISQYINAESDEEITITDLDCAYRSSSQKLLPTDENSTQVEETGDGVIGEMSETESVRRGSSLRMHDGRLDGIGCQTDTEGEHSKEQCQYLNKNEHEKNNHSTGIFSRFLSVFKTKESDKKKNVEVKSKIRLYPPEILKEYHDAAK